MVTSYINHSRSKGSCDLRNRNHSFQTGVPQIIKALDLKTGQFRIVDDANAVDGVRNALSIFSQLFCSRDQVFCIWDLA